MALSVACLPVWIFEGEIVTHQGAAGVLDLAHLAQYTGGDRELEKEILGMVVPSVEGYLDQMRQASGATEWQHAAHAMKGVGRGVGAFRLADLAEAIECRFVEQGAQREAMIGELEAEVSAVAGFIDDRLKD